MSSYRQNFFKPLNLEAHFIHTYQHCYVRSKRYVYLNQNTAGTCSKVWFDGEVEGCTIPDEETDGLYSTRWALAKKSLYMHLQEALSHVTRREDNWVNAKYAAAYPGQCQNGAAWLAMGSTWGFGAQKLPQAPAFARGIAGQGT